MSLFFPPQSQKEQGGLSGFLICSLLEARPPPPHGPCCRPFLTASGSDHTVWSEGGTGILFLLSPGAWGEWRKTSPILAGFSHQLHLPRKPQDRSPTA